MVDGNQVEGSSGKDTERKSPFVLAALTRGDCVSIPNGSRVESHQNLCGGTQGSVDHMSMLRILAHRLDREP